LYTIIYIPACSSTSKHLIFQVKSLTAVKITCASHPCKVKFLCISIPPCFSHYSDTDNLSTDFSTTDIIDSSINKENTVLVLISELCSSWLVYCSKQCFIYSWFDFWCSNVLSSTSNGKYYNNSKTRICWWCNIASAM